MLSGYTDCAEYVQQLNNKVQNTIIVIWWNADKLQSALSIPAQDVLVKETTIYILNFHTLYADSEKTPIYTA